MHHEIQVFIDSLVLTSVKAGYLASRLDDDPNLAAFLSGESHQSPDLLMLACLSAKTCLGDDAVDMPPLNQTEVNENWSANALRSCIQVLTTGDRSQACWQPPACIVLPRSAQDVSQTLKVVKFFKTRFAVRSGGHSPNPG